MKSKKRQMIGQINLFDLLTRNVELGYTDETHRGEAIPFKYLKEYYGKRIILAEWDIEHHGSNNDEWIENHPSHKVVMITTYHDKNKGKNDPVHKGRGLKGDTIGYISDGLQKKAWDGNYKTKRSRQNWLRESACKNRRRSSKEETRFCFYEYAV